MQRVLDFLKKAGVYFLATVDGDQPEVRPFGTAEIIDGKLYIQTGHVKPVARQIAANPKVELCGFCEGRWIRISGEAVHDPRTEAQASLLEAYPSLQGMYKVDDGNTAVYYLKNAKATISSFTEAPDSFEF
jgi:uncharacterized pyridoxamine 5'-phosphate oxidase family protein